MVAIIGAETFATAAAGGAKVFDQQNDRIFKLIGVVVVSATTVIDVPDLALGTPTHFVLSQNNLNPASVSFAGTTMTINVQAASGSHIILYGVR